MSNLEKKDTKLQLDIVELRKHAALDLDRGAVVLDYSLDVMQACSLLNQALASEILCMLRYRQHQFAVFGSDYPHIAEEFCEHAKSEEKHILMLAERISQLGGKPDFNPDQLLSRSATEFGTAENVKIMIKENLVAERIAIEVYRKMIVWFGDADPTTRGILEGILADEEDHAHEMANLQNPFSKFTVNTVADGANGQAGPPRVQRSNGASL